jgi:hypothetical protein
MGTVWMLYCVDVERNPPMYAHQGSERSDEERPVSESRQARGNRPVGNVRDNHPLDGHSLENPEAIVQRMSAVRCNLHEHLGDVVGQARAVTNWRYLVQLNPLVSTGVAALCGYLLVPKKVHVMHPRPDDLAKLAKQQRIVMQPESGKAKKQGTVRPLVSMLVGAALRSAMAAAGSELSRVWSEGAWTFGSDQRRQGGHPAAPFGRSGPARHSPPDASMQGQQEYSQHPNRPVPR